MAIKLTGNWKIGFALDLHMIKSEYAGTDEYGHSRFNNTRSEIGELVYNLKYKNNEAAVNILVRKIKDAIKGLESFDYIIPVPPSDLSRPKQPVLLVCQALSAEVGVPILFDALKKCKPTSQVKNEKDKDKNKRLELLKGSMTLTQKANLLEKKILLIDDLFDTGSTLSVATEVLYAAGHAKTVCVLTLTKTMSNR
jgi:predicted amidophosphoribosyltransferase